jgi:glutathione reductase (NADPH)
MSKFDYDLFVIGGGSGGVRAARTAAGYGARVAIAEEYRYGGTCVIRGCVPKKLLVYASRFCGDFGDAAGFGWTLPAPTFEWSRLIANKDKEIARLERAYLSNLDKAGVVTLTTRATLEDCHTVRLTAERRTVTAKVVLLATGAAPATDHNLPGREHIITSNEAFDLQQLPNRVVIAGGGYIAVEFASIFNGLGAETTLIYRGDKILRGFDLDLREDLTVAMRMRGVRVLTERTFTSIERGATHLRGVLSDGGVVDADQIMFAIGRRPNTYGLGLKAAGVAVGTGGEIKVDAWSKTSAHNIYAVGDVTDRVKLTPVAIREGQAFADTVFGGKPWSVEHAMIPTAVFSEPEIGTVGFSEEAARERVGPVDIYKMRFRPLKHTLSGRDEQMLIKLVVDQRSGRVLGCHVLGADAAEIVQMAAVAMRMGATKADLDATMALHPTAGEELVTLRDKWVPLAAE